LSTNFDFFNALKKLAGNEHTLLGYFYFHTSSPLAVKYKTYGGAIQFNFLNLHRNQALFSSVRSRIFIGLSVMSITAPEERNVLVKPPTMRLMFRSLETRCSQRGQLVTQSDGLFLQGL
jgi:hypothetical protein